MFQVSISQPSRTKAVEHMLQDKAAVLAHHRGMLSFLVTVLSGTGMRPQ